jgi:phosphatidate cytidylyltransferase
VEANLKRRTITALVVISVLLYVIAWAPSAVFTGLVLLAATLALREYFSMSLPGRFFEQALGTLFGLGVALLAIFPKVSDAFPWAALLIVAVLASYLFFPGAPAEKVSRLGCLLLGGLYVGLLLPHWIFLRATADGRQWVLFVLAVILAGDTTAYFIGRRFGRKKLAPEISPGKTWAGAWGYMLGGLVAGGLAAYLLLPQYPVAEMLALSIVVATLGQLGDLVESLLKRAFQVKDSGSLLPGHGGVLDRVDSLVFPTVFVYAYLRVLHP